MQEMGGLTTVGLQMTPALFGTPSSSGELLGSSSRGQLYYETSQGSSRRLNDNGGSSRALLLTPLRDGPSLIGMLWYLDGLCWYISMISLVYNSGRANPLEPQPLPLHQSYLEPVIFNLNHMHCCRSSGNGPTRILTIMTNTIFITSLW